MFRQNEFSFKLGTERIAAALQQEGRPDRTFKTVLVAGTNGKGSVASLLHAGLVGSGLKTGLFTSPHLVDVRERIRLDGHPISQSAFLELGGRCLHRWSDDVPLDERLTFFELLTLMAALFFAESNVDVAVFEVGLGGRLDATNALSHQMAVITPVGFDHTRNLGNTLDAIFSEKAATIVPHCPAIACRPVGWSVADVRDACTRFRPQPLWVEGDEFDRDQDAIRIGHTSASSDWVPLAGAHQLQNGALALSALDLARSELKWSIAPRPQLESHLATARWPGRWTAVEAGERTLFLDCAHNLEAASAISTHLIETFKETKVTILFGAVRGKPIAKMLMQLLPQAEQVIVTPINNPRACPADEIAKIIDAMGGQRLQADSVAQALQWATERKPPIVVLGSVFLIGEVLRELSCGAEALRVIE